METSVTAAEEIIDVRASTSSVHDHEGSDDRRLRIDKNRDGRPRRSGTRSHDPHPAGSTP
jgi:hypothetical protein